MSRTITIDWLLSTSIPAPSEGMEYSLHALGEPVHVREDGYVERPVHPNGKTTIRSAAVVTAEKPGVQVALGDERPNRKAA